MNQETIKWLREVMDNIKVSIIGRYEEGTLKRKDQLTINEMLGNIQEALKKEMGENQLVETLVASLGTLQEGLSIKLEQESIAGLKLSVGEVTAKLDEVEKVMHISNALQLDAESIMPLMEQIRQKQEEVRQSFQAAVDLDYKMYGKISELTMNALEAFHFEISADKQVIRASEFIPIPEPEQQKEKKEPMGKQLVQDAPEPEKQLPEEEEKRQYLYIRPQSKEQFQETIDFLKKHGARFDPEHKDKNQELKPAWYMMPGSISEQELKEHHVEFGEEEREYLELPHQSKEKFTETIAELKKNGAHYDKKRTQWYLTPESNRAALMNYLNQLRGKESVLGKLSQNKEAMEKNGKHTGERQKESER